MLTIAEIPDRTIEKVDLLSFRFNNYDWLYLDFFDFFQSTKVFFVIVVFYQPKTRTRSGFPPFNSSVKE